MTSALPPRHHRAMSDDPSHRAFLLRVLTTTGLTQTQLAHRAGLDPSTLSRFLSEGREGHTLRANTLRKIELATGVPLDESAAPPQPGFAESEAAPLLVDSESPLNASLRSSPHPAPTSTPGPCTVPRLKARAIAAATFCSWRWAKRPPPAISSVHRFMTGPRAGPKPCSACSSRPIWWPPPAIPISPPPPRRGRQGGDQGRGCAFDPLTRLKSHKIN